MVAMSKILAALGAAAAAVLTSVAPASADAPDDQFLADLDAAGIRGEPADLIDLGHRLCDALGQTGFGIGISPRQAAIMALGVEAQGKGIDTPAQQTDFRHASISAYCPDQRTW